MDQDQLRYEYIARQIEREDGLINYRLTWTLQLNGLLFAALALLGDKTSHDLADFLRLRMPMAGAMVSFAGLLGIVAANLQLLYLTRLWKFQPQRGWPRPFGDKLAYFLGTVPSLVTVIVLLFIWLGLFNQNRKSPESGFHVTASTNSAAYEGATTRSLAPEIRDHAQATPKAAPADSVR